MELIEKLKWRYATKRMNGAKVPQQKVDNILEAIHLTASSVGMQPFDVLVIENPEIRAKIRPIANNQSQVDECSHLLVFAAWENITEERGEEYKQAFVKSRGEFPERSSVYLQKIIERGRENADVNFQWAARQSYIAMGTALVAAAVEGVDATPMEGFNAAALDEFLKLKEKGLKSVLLLTLGYRDEANDFLVKLPKVRREKAKMFQEM